MVVNRPPTAEAQGDRVVAPGQIASFNGSRSTDVDGEMTDYRWNFGDGNNGSGAAVTHRYTDPGRYQVLLTVEDDSAGPCNFATASLAVQVNHPPVAEAGEDIEVATAQPFTQDASRSYDTDGRLVDHIWRLDEQVVAPGERAEIQFDRPGEYLLTLSVNDDSGVVNSVATDRVRVIVNDPPVAVAGEDLALAVGEIAVFDGTGSTDRDGRVVEHARAIRFQPTRSVRRYAHGSRRFLFSFWCR